jgi:hypothetical protein
MPLSPNVSAYRSSESPRSQSAITKDLPDLALPARLAQPVPIPVRRRNTMPVPMYHNPRGNTSRKTLALLRGKSVAGTEALLLSKRQDDVVCGAPVDRVVAAAADHVFPRRPVIVSAIVLPQMTHLLSVALPHALHVA